MTYKDLLHRVLYDMTDEQLNQEVTVKLDYLNDSLEGLYSVDIYIPDPEAELIATVDPDRCYFVV